MLQGVSGSRQNAWQYVNPVNVIWVEPIYKTLVFRGDHWHIHRGRRRRAGQRMRWIR